MGYPNLAAERARLGLSVDELAEELHVSRRTLYYWLNSGAFPESAIERMMQLFGCKRDYLLSHEALVPRRTERRNGR